MIFLVQIYDMFQIYNMYDICFRSMIFWFRSMINGPIYDKLARSMFLFRCMIYGPDL